MSKADKFDWDALMKTVLVFLGIILSGIIGAWIVDRLGHI